MKKMRLESLEHLIDDANENQIIALGFHLADQSVRDLRKIGVESDFIEILILKDKEYHRKDYIFSHEPTKNTHG